MDMSFIFFVGVALFAVFYSSYAAFKKEAKGKANPPTQTLDEATRLKNQRENALKSLKSEKAKRPVRKAAFSTVHVHPSDTDGHESVEPYLGSIGEQSSEGCAEHAYIRYLTPIVEEESDDERLIAVGRSIVLGEILAKPKFRRWR